MEERWTRYDLENQQEKADAIIVQQVLRCTGEAQITVVSDDTDVFILLLHHYHQAGLDVPLIMESLCKERVIVDIKSTLAKQTQIIKHLLTAHAIHCSVVLWFGERLCHQSPESWLRSISYWLVYGVVAERNLFQTVNMGFVLRVGEHKGLIMEAAASYRAAKQANICAAASVLHNKPPSSCGSAVRMLSQCDRIKQ
ncbi:hypothetical protein ABVT39_021658, partial [Epinephelus coioides]